MAFGGNGEMYVDQGWPLFYSTIFEAITARSLEVSDLVVRKDNSSTEATAEAITPTAKGRPTTNLQISKTMRDTSNDDYPSR